MESLVDITTTSFKAILAVCVVFTAGYAYNGKQDPSVRRVCLLAYSVWRPRSLFIDPIEGVEEGPATMPGLHRPCGLPESFFKTLGHVYILPTSCLTAYLCVQYGQSSSWILLFT